MVAEYNDVLKVFTYMKYISLAVFAMLFVSLGTTLLTSKDIYANKGTFTATVDNINNLSNNENFLILLMLVPRSLIYKL